MAAHSALLAVVLRGFVCTGLWWGGVSNAWVTKPAEVIAKPHRGGVARWAVVPTRTVMGRSHTGASVAWTFAFAPARSSPATSTRAIVAPAGRVAGGAASALAGAARATARAAIRGMRMNTG